MSGKFALVIEDDRDEALLFAKAVETTAFEVEIVYSGDTALARLATVTPDLVVLDLHIPRTTGIEVLRHIRGDARLQETHVIVVTGDPQTAESIRDEADLVLIKPVGFDQLRNLAERVTSAAAPDE